MKKIFFAITLLTIASTYTTNNSMYNYIYIVAGYNWRSKPLSPNLVSRFGKFERFGGRYFEQEGIPQKKDLLKLDKASKTNITFTVRTVKKNITLHSWELLKRASGLVHGTKMDASTIISKNITKALKLNIERADTVVGAIELSKDLQANKAVTAILAFNLKNASGYDQLDQTIKDNINNLYKKILKGIPVKYNFNQI